MVSLLDLLIPTFPREAYIPGRKLFFNKEDFIRCVNSFNRVKNLHYCLYEPDNPLSQPHHLNPVLDKIFFDMDNKDALENLKKAHYSLCRLKFKHLMIFSGRHYQLYVFCKPTELIYSKGTLRSVHLWLSKELGLIWGDEKQFDLDFHILGNVAQGGRVPNTMNLKSGLYCIPLTEKDLELGEAHIKSKASKQCFDFEVCGENLLSLEEFDTGVIEQPSSKESVDFKDSELESDSVVDSFFPCVKQWLVYPKLAKLRQRYFFALYCKCSSISRHDCDLIAKKYWGGVKDSSGAKTKYKEFVEEKQVKNAYETDSCFPSCKKLKEEGLCPEHCKFCGVWSIV